MTAPPVTDKGPRCAGHATGGGMAGKPIQERYKTRPGLSRPDPCRVYNFRTIGEIIPEAMRDLLEVYR